MCVNGEFVKDTQKHVWGTASIVWTCDGAVMVKTVPFEMIHTIASELQLWVIYPEIPVNRKGHSIKSTAGKVDMKM